MNTLFIILFYGLIAYGAISLVKSIYKDDKE